MTRRRDGKRLKKPALLAFSALVAFGLVAGDLSPASAQERERSRGLFEFLFGGQPLPRRDGRPPKRVQSPNAAKPKARRPRPAVAAAPQISIAEKAADAKTVLVVGDFMGGGLAEGLDEAFAETPGIRIVARTSGSSGFVRQDVFDWPERIGEIVDQEKPAAIIVMLGSNDRQQMKVGGVRETKLSAAWTTEYGRRTEALGQALRAKGVPFLWVGMPSFKPSTMTTDMLAFNDIYKEAATAAGGEFVDVWDGFVDENGAFVSSGPDIAGQPVRLRAGDGVNLTKAGKRKVAFYVEKPLNRILGTSSLLPAAPVAIGPAVLLTPAALPDLNDIRRTQPVSLADPDLDGSTELLGGAAARPANPTKTAVERLVIDGMAADAQPGRADDFFAAKRQPPETAPAIAAEPGTDPEPTTAINP